MTNGGQLIRRGWTYNNRGLLHHTGHHQASSIGAEACIEAAQQSHGNTSGSVLGSGKKLIRKDRFWVKMHVRQQKFSPLHGTSLGFEHWDGVSH